MKRILAYLRLDQPSVLGGLTAIAAGGIAVLTANQLQPEGDGLSPAWMVYWIVLLASAALFLHGLLALVVVSVRQGQGAWARRSRFRVRTPFYLVSDAHDSAPPPPGDGLTHTDAVQAVVIPGAPRANLSAEEAIRGWEVDRARVIQLRHAVDVLITWLYRRQNWDGLSTDGKYTEPAPAKTWGWQKYKQLGIPVSEYEPPAQVAGEPGWTPPERPPARAPLPPPPPKRDSARAIPDQKRAAEILAQAMRVDQSRVVPRPPLALRLSGTAWRAAQPEFCAGVIRLQTSGSQLVDELQALSIHASEEENQSLRDAVDKFVQQFDAFVAPFFGSFKSVPGGEAALAPAWRQGDVARVSGRRRLLDSMVAAYQCREPSVT